jgi:hypothetical protein
MKFKAERFRFWVLMPSWESLKSAGEIRIVNSISYGSLFLVPALAAVWPGVRFLLAQISVAMPLIPVALVIAFFASLSVVLAQIVYQVRCPQIVKGYNKIRYIVEQVAIQNSLKSKDALDSYVGEVLEAVRKVKPDGAPFHRHDLVWGAILLKHHLSSINSLRPDDRLDIIRSAGRLEFIAASYCNPASRVLASALYAVSVFLLLFVVARQAYFVAIEGGVLLWLKN